MINKKNIRYEMKLYILEKKNYILEQNDSFKEYYCVCELFNNLFINLPCRHSLS